MKRHRRHRAIPPLRRHGWYRGIIFPLLAALLAWSLLLTGPARAAENCRGQSAHLNDGGLTILQATLDRNRLILSEVLAAYETDQGLYLPLGELMRSFEFAITVDPAQARAEGWFLNERRRFALDLAARCRVSVAGTSATVDPALVSLQDDDIYIHSTLIEQWFPVTLEYDPSRLLLSVAAEEPLPVQQRLEREARWERLGGRRAGDTPGYPTVEVPYRYWDWPFLDATVETRIRQVDSGEATRDSRYRIVGAGDLLKMNTRFAVSGNEQDSIDDVVVTMGRRDPGGELLGPLGAREYAFGDLAIPRDPLIANNALGRGMTISSFPLDRPEEFDRFRLQGELPLGWDVELYRNGQLIDFQSGGERYDFTDVPLEFGLNRFRLVFHGPQGQVREEVVQRVIGPGMIRPGKQHYRLTAIRERDDRRFVSQGPADDRFLASYELGVSRFLSLGGSARSLMLDEERRDYVTVHANAAIPRLFGRIEYAAAQAGGYAVSGLLSTRLAGVDITGETAHFFDFDSERTRINDAPGELLNRSELRLNTRPPRWGPLWTSLGATVNYDRGTEGERIGGQTRLSVGSGYGTLTHLFEADRLVTDSGDSLRTRQHLLASRRWRSASLRGGAVQELSPDQFVSHIGASADWRLSPHATLRFGVNRAPVEKVTTYSTGVSWQLGRIAIGASLQATDTEEYTAGLSISTGVARDPGRGRWHAFSQPQTLAGAVAAQVFLDENGNDVRDPGEPAIPHAEVGINGTGTRATTDAQGHAFLTGLPTHREVQVTLETGSLENPFWLSEHAGRQLVLRPGRTAEISMPIVPTGGVEGAIYRAEGARLKPVSNQPVQLFDMSGELLQQTRSAYDGYYYFDRIPPGYYRLRPGPARDGRWPEQEDLLVEIQGGVMIISPVDVVLGSLTLDTRPDMLARRAPEPTVSRPKPAPAPQFRTESWVLAQSPADFTIQLIAASTEAAVRQYITRHGLTDQAAYILSTHHGSPWFLVVYGRFSTYREARAALRELPPALREAEPWPRRFDELHGVIRRYRIKP